MALSTTEAASRSPELSVRSRMWDLTQELSPGYGRKVFKVPPEQTRIVHDRLLSSGLTDLVPLELRGMGRNPLRHRPSQIYLLSDKVNPSESYWDPDEPLDLIDRTGKWDEQILGLRFQFEGKGTFVELTTELNQYLSFTAYTFFHTDLGILSFRPDLTSDQLQTLLGLFEAHAKGQPVAHEASGFIVGANGQKVNPTHKFPF